MNKPLIHVVCFAVFFHPTLQDCPEEVSFNGISVTWHQTPAASNIESDPLCYNDEHLVTRNCTGSVWIPSIDELDMCSKVIQYFDLSSCPPGFHKISKNNNDYCYQIHTPSSWNFPCLESGGASVITDLDSEEIDALLHSLKVTSTSKYFWLPAQRSTAFQPLTWYIPGSNWGRRVEFNNNLPAGQLGMFMDCLLLDIEEQKLDTETCSTEHPSLCFYLNDLKYPGMCPKGYHAFRFMSDDSVCLGIEKSDNTTGLNHIDFIKSKCKKPMGSDDDSYLKRFIFKKIAEMDNLPEGMWCWFSNVNKIIHSTNDSSTFLPSFNNFESMINNVGNLAITSPAASLPCMACETEMIFGDTEFYLEYDEKENRIYLTVYYPSGLWKYDNNDKGIQCFTDAEGFIDVIEINDLPFINIQYQDTENLEGDIEKVVYVIELATDMSAQYWCEGHMKNFSLLSTDKIIVNPRGSQVHVFSLHISINTNIFTDNLDTSELIENITLIFNAEKALLMAISDHTVDKVKVIVHLHISVNESSYDMNYNLQATYSYLIEIAEQKLYLYNYTFITLSSATVCLPTTSSDYILLDWNLTPIGHFATPNQFCLQSNGLPVKRVCIGSYLLGSSWGSVEGNCDRNYTPSMTTTFLYKFVKGYTTDNTTARFLIDGLNFVLSDTDIMIPADIYYLSMSLLYISNIAQHNQTTIDMGDVENIAWVMDRIMDVDGGSLHLAQTLNSSNVLLDSVKDIIEILAQKNILRSGSLSEDDAYQLAVKNKFVIQISYPQLNNITGVALYKTGSSNKFTNMRIEPLYKNTSLDNIQLENLEIATWLPDEILKNLKKVKNDCENDTINLNDIHIIINMYHNDAMFHELTSKKHYINSRIVEISVPGFISNLEYPIPLLFGEINVTEYHEKSLKFCGFWSFKSSEIGSIPGTWAKQGCFMKNSFNNITLCECFHLTHFGQLINIERIKAEDDNMLDNHHTEILNFITLFGSFLSLLGIMGIWITALVFNTWRKKAGTKVLLQLSTSIALPLIVMVIFNLDNRMFVKEDDKCVIVNHMRILCVGLGALLHYSILANFMWMLITATLQFTRYVRVLGVSRPARFMVKYTMVGWGVPFIPVIVILSTDYENYIPDPSIGYPICYPNGFYFIVCVVVPICVILLINVILFIMVIRSISQCPDMRVTDKPLIWAQLRLSILLFFLLGLTWIFGIFSFTKYVIWSYLFSLTSSVQGFVLFIYFVIFDPSTRNLWITAIKPEYSQNSSRKSVMSISSG